MTSKKQKEIFKDSEKQKEIFKDSEIQTENNYFYIDDDRLDFFSKNLINTLSALNNTEDPNFYKILYSNIIKLDMNTKFLIKILERQFPSIYIKKNNTSSFVPVKRKLSKNVLETKSVTPLPIKKTIKKRRGPKSSDEIQEEESNIIEDQYNEQNRQSGEEELFLKLMNQKKRGMTKQEEKEYEEEYQKQESKDKLWKQQAADEKIKQHTEWIEAKSLYDIEEKIENLLEEELNTLQNEVSKRHFEISKELDKERKELIDNLMRENNHLPKKELENKKKILKEQIGEESFKIHDELNDYENKMTKIIQKKIEQHKKKMDPIFDRYWKIYSEYGSFLDE